MVGVLATFVVVFLGLALGSAAQKSAVWDEPIHLSAGVAAWNGDYRIDIEHPPLLRQWAALPLFLTGSAHFDTTQVDRVAPDDWPRVVYPFTQKFLFADHDADRLLLRGRLMIAALGALLGALLFLWVREWGGFAPAAAALALYTLEPNIAAHSALVTTDAGAACFIFGSIYFLWRTCRKVSAANVGGLAVFVALAVLSKYSALLLAPMVALVLVIGAWRKWGPRPGAAAAIVVLVAAVTWGGIWSAYGFQYLPSGSPQFRYDFRHAREVQGNMSALAAVVGWVDDRRLLPNAYSQGLLYSQAKTHKRRGFLAGSISTSGWWYYFPAAMAFKTPMALLAVIAVGTAVSARRRALPWPRAPGIFLVIPITIYLGSAMTARINIGLRHVLPIYPFLIVIGGVGLAALVHGSRAARRAGIAILGVGIVEFAGIYPHTLAFFNLLAGGPAQGADLLVDSNLDWGQDLKPLKQWMDANGVTHVNLAYFGTADPRYYGIDVTHLPGCQYFSPAETRPPQVPGYVAISATVRSGVYLTDRERAFYAGLRRLAPVATIGYSIFVYRVEHPWW